MAKTETISIDKIAANNGQIPGIKANPRLIKDEKYRKLKRSLEDNPEMLELRELLVYEHDGKFICIGGNMRYRACKELGYKEIPCKVIPPTATPEQLNAYIIKDNAGFGEWDWDMLANEWDADLLDDWGVDAWQPDIEEDEKKKMDNPDVDDVEVEESDIESRVSKGDIWQLGKHRLMCGDSTDAASVALLMNGERADICFTSPPYNMKWDTDIQAYSKSKGCIPGSYNKGQTYKEYDDAHQSDEEYQSLLDNALEVALDNCDDVLFNIGILTSSRVNVATMLGNHAQYLTEIISWVKSNSMPLGLPTHKGLLSHRSEPIFCFSKGSRAFSHPQWDAGQGINVVETSHAASNEYAKEHHATFPIDLPSFFVKNFTEKSILDLFGGTGTTMIAAEQLGRKCYMMELDPHYCDVILARWEKLTGKEAIKLN